MQSRSILKQVLEERRPYAVGKKTLWCDYLSTRSWMRRSVRKNSSRLSSNSRVYSSYAQVPVFSCSSYYPCVRASTTGNLRISESASHWDTFQTAY